MFPGAADLGRLGVFTLALLLVVYVGVSYSYAERLSRVVRNELDRTAEIVAADREDVAFESADGLTLKGWWFPARQDRDRAVVLVHGKDQNRIEGAFRDGRADSAPAGATPAAWFCTIGPPSPSRLSSSPRHSPGSMARITLALSA